MPIDRHQDSVSAAMLRSHLMPKDRHQDSVSAAVLRSHLMPKFERKKHMIPSYLSEEIKYVFNKTHSCPVCFGEFKSPAVRQSSLRPAGSDPDLRPRFKKYDPLKYEVVMCPACGYAALSGGFHKLTPPQARLIREGISKNFTPTENPDVFTYDDAYYRYQLALANAIVRRASEGEKAYLCLKTAWIVRGKCDAIEEGLEYVSPDDYENTVKKLKQEEGKYLENALNGFIIARDTEGAGVYGLSSTAIDYIIAINAMKFGRLEVVRQMLEILLKQSGLSREMNNHLLEMKGELKRTAKEREGNPAE